MMHLHCAICTSPILLRIKNIPFFFVLKILSNVKNQNNDIHNFIAIVFLSIFLHAT